MGRYLVTIKETLLREVIVDAEDVCDACEVANDLCNAGVIDLGIDDWHDRNVDGREAFEDDVRPNTVVYSDDYLKEDNANGPR